MFPQKFSALRVFLSWIGTLVLCFNLRPNIVSSIHPPRMLTCTRFSTQQHTQRQHNKWSWNLRQINCVHTWKNTRLHSASIFDPTNSGSEKKAFFGVFQLHFPSKGPSYFCIQEINVTNPSNHLFWALSLPPPPPYSCLSLLIWTPTPRGWNLTLSPIVNTFPGFSKVPPCSIIRTVCWPCCWHSSCRYFCVAVGQPDSNDRMSQVFRSVSRNPYDSLKLPKMKFWSTVASGRGTRNSCVFCREQHLEISSGNRKINGLKHS